MNSTELIHKLKTCEYCNKEFDQPTVFIFTI